MIVFISLLLFAAPFLNYHTTEAHQTARIRVSSVCFKDKIVLNLLRFQRTRQGGCLGDQAERQEREQSEVHCKVVVLTKIR